MFLRKINRGITRVFGVNGNSGRDKNYRVSVIIPFRNEEKNIRENLISIMKQDYPGELLEVIYVNDFSTDKGEEILLQNKGENVKVISSEKGEGTGFKKRSVAAGIKESRGEIIITTDADCKYGSRWITGMVNSFDEDTGLVSGPVAFNKRETIFNKLQSIEFQGLVLAGTGLIGAEDATICNGANLAFRRSAFEEAGGYEDNLHLASGDDEILMQKIDALGKWKIKFCKEKEGMVFTDANNSMSDLIEQRKRWASKGMFYKKKNLVIKLLLIFLYYLSIPSLVILSIIEGRIWWYLLAGALIMKLFVEWSIIRKGEKYLFEKNSAFIFLLAEVFHIPYILFSAVGGAMGNFRWKEREIKR
jgi:cellulose synthase/poly-beta-1,6-N-acetylglucosamine synthase-like glycosyltransferase